MEEEIKEMFARARTESQLLAWCLFDSLVILATAAVCVRRCCFLRTEGSLPYIEEYERLESEAAVEEFKTQMDEEAKATGQEFVKELFKKNSELDGYTKMKEIRHQVAKKYPRATGNLSKPYVCREPRDPRPNEAVSNGHCNADVQCESNV